MSSNPDADLNRPIFVEDASQTITLHCFRCHKTPGDGDTPLKRCRGCRGRNYCSKQCQRDDWPTHKRECQILAEGRSIPSRQRTIFSYRRDAFTVTEPITPINLDIDPDVIYYLKISKPHDKYVAISGPHYPLEKLYVIIRGEVRIHHSADATLVTELIDRGILPSIEHFQVPLPSDRSLGLKLFQEKNAKVAWAMPCTVWTVTMTTLTSLASSSTLTVTKSL